MKENKNKISVIKIGLLGDTAVGKTAIINSIFGVEFNLQMIMTIGTEKLQTKFKLKNNEDIKLVIWDSGGDERGRHIAMKCMKTVHGIMLIFDFTKKKSFNNLNIWLNDIKDNLDDPLIILVGNKVNINRDDWEVTSEEASKFAKEKGIAFFETSAKTGQGINEGLSYIVNESYDKLMRMDNKKIDLNNIKPNNNSNCPGNKKCKNNKK